MPEVRPCSDTSGLDNKRLWEHQSICMPDDNIALLVCFLGHLIACLSCPHRMEAAETRRCAHIISLPGGED